MAQNYVVDFVKQDPCDVLWVLYEIVDIDVNIEAALMS